MISAPNKTMQSIQATINSRILSPVTMIHPAAVGFRNGHSVVDNANPHLGKRYVLKMDIHDFFFSIRSPRVKKTFEKIGYPENVSKVLGTLCCLHRHLPQGAPTSPSLSNIVSYEMDRKLAALAAEYGLTYTRYADDLTFSGDVFPKEQIIPRIKQIIRDEKFEPNHKKTRFINEYGRKIITGVSISSGVKLTIPKARKREIRKNVYFILTKGLAEHQRRIGSSDPVYLKRLIGELCYWRSIEPDNSYVSDSIAALSPESTRQDHSNQHLIRNRHPFIFNFGIIPFHGFANTSLHGSVYVRSHTGKAELLCTCFYQICHRQADGVCQQLSDGIGYLFGSYICRFPLGNRTINRVGDALLSVFPAKNKSFMFGAIDI